MNPFEDNDSNSALQAQYEALKIAFAPVIFQAARSMRDLGVLQELYEHRKPLCAGELAAKLQLSEYAVTVLLETGLSADIVKQDKDYRYSLTKTGYFLLNDTMVNINMDFNHYVNYKGLYELDQALQNQKPEGLKHFSESKTIYPVLSKLPPKAKQSWFAFDHYYSDTAFTQAVNLILRQHPQNILDIGGNTGKFALALTKEDPDVNVTLFDLPQQLELAKENIGDRIKGSRLRMIPADILNPATVIPSGYDTIWMSQFLDCFSREQIIAILQKIKASMGPETTLCIMEPFWDRQRFAASAYSIINTSPYFTAMANGYSKMYHSDTFTEFIEKAGLSILDIQDNIGVCQSIITAGQSR
ncbi:MAG: methyltransferase [Campylobacterota bacterium]